MGKKLYQIGPDTIVAESRESAIEWWLDSFEIEPDCMEPCIELEPGDVIAVMLTDHGHITDSGQSTTKTVADWLEHPDVADAPCPSMVWSTEY